MEYTAKDIKSVNSVQFSIHGLSAFTRTCEVLKTSPAAIMIRTEIFDETEPTIRANIWLARSQIKVLSKEKKVFNIELPGWIYETKMLTHDNLQSYGK